MLQRLKRIDRLVAALEKGVLLVLVAALVVVPIGHIVLRAIGQGGIAWQLEFVRMAMLWVAFLGASLATAERRHITIDLLERSLSMGTKAAFNIVVQLLALAVTGYLAWSTWGFVKILKEFGEPTGPVLGVPQWISASIIPVALAIIAARMALLVLEDLRGIVRKDFEYLAGPDTEGRLY